MKKVSLMWRWRWS